MYVTASTDVACEVSEYVSLGMQDFQTALPFVQWTYYYDVIGPSDMADGSIWTALQRCRC